MLKRIFLFIAVNILVLFTIYMTLNVLGVRGTWTPTASITARCWRSARSSWASAAPSFRC